METQAERILRIRREYAAAIAQGAERDILLGYIKLLTDEMSFIEPMASDAREAMRQPL